MEAVARVIYKEMGFSYESRTVNAMGIPYGSWAKALKAAEAVLALTPAATSGPVCNVVPPPETYGGSPDEPWTGKMPTSGSEAGGEVKGWAAVYDGQIKSCHRSRETCVADAEHYQAIHPVYLGPAWRHQED